MSILSVEQVSHSFNDNWLFKYLTLGISKGQRIALVGVNGSGKSTLMRILAGKLPPQEGKVVRERGLTVGYLEQDPDFSNQTTVADYIYSIDNKQQQVIRQYEKLLDSELPDEDEMARLTDELSELNAWEYEHQIKTILQRLSIADTTQLIETLSGGQKKRLALGKLLIDETDVLILDEPTNHLDIQMIEWLESFLTTGQKTVVMVTHDRYFLDNICNNIVELENKRLYSYTGNYRYFLERKAERETEEAVVLQKNKNLLKKELEWMRRMPKARSTKSKSRIDAFHSLEQKTKKEKNNGSIELSTKVSRQGNKILELKDVSHSFDSKNVLQSFSYTFKKGDRIGLAGKNGSGKSTFLNVITGNLIPKKGVIDVGETTVFGYYKQGGLEFRENEKVIDVVKNGAEYISMADGKSITASQLLTHFLFPPAKQHLSVDKLSGGERKRLQLMRILMKNPNFLILDEPTNDLDIDTLNILEDFLERYNGVLVLVSHDRYLMDKLTEQLFIIESEGIIKIFNGNYTDYKSETEDIMKATQSRNVVNANITTITDKKAKLTYKEEMELAQLETRIEENENKVKELSGQIGLNHLSHTLLLKSLSELEIVKDQLEQDTLRWMALQEIKEKV